MGLGLRKERNLDPCARSGLRVLYRSKDRVIDVDIDIDENIQVEDKY